MVGSIVTKGHVNGGAQSSIDGKGIGLISVIRVDESESEPHEIVLSIVIGTGESVGACVNSCAGVWRREVPWSPKSNKACDTEDVGKCIAMNVAAVDGLVPEFKKGIETTTICNDRSGDRMRGGDYEQQRM